MNQSRHKGILKFHEEQRLAHESKSRLNLVELDMQQFLIQLTEKKSNAHSWISNTLQM